MVNTRIVSRYTGALPVGKDDSRNIAGGPLYSAEEVLGLFENRGNGSITPWTQKCIKDIQKLELDGDDLLELIGIAVRSSRFLGSEWCQQKPGGPWAACDAYSVMRREWIPNARKEMDIEYYIKFAIGKTGQIILLVSCHPPEDRR